MPGLLDANKPLPGLFGNTPRGGSGGVMINPLAVANSLYDSWNGTQNNDVVQRGSIAPLATYSDGVTRPAWPGLIAAPLESFHRMWERGDEANISNPDALAASAQDGFDVAGGTMTGGLAATAAGVGTPRNAVGIFGGRLAATADHAALGRAETLAAQGVPREQIWTDTGWFKGVDGKWRFEIDDSGGRVSNYAWNEAQGQRPQADSTSWEALAAAPTKVDERTGDVFRHNDLYAAYPDLAEGRASIARTDERGGITDGLGFSAQGPEIGDVESIALHELQHGVQKREGFFPRGTSLGDLRQQSGMFAKMQEAGPAPPHYQSLPWWKRAFTNRDEHQKVYDAYNKSQNEKYATLSRDAHHRAGSEVEARNVEARRLMTPEQRRASPPWLTEDVPYADQIFANSPTGSSVPLALQVAEQNAPKAFQNSSRNANIYDPPRTSQRPFEADYPNGARADETGRLTHDIEGRPLAASHVVGRQMVGGEDAALSPSQYDAVTTGLFGKVPQGVAARNLRGNAGILTVDRRSGPVDLFYDRSLPGAQAERVVGHEIGHAVDEIAGQLPVDGLSGELRAVYNALNNPQSHGKHFGPEQNRYKGGDVDRELVAEAVRAYMADPNYLKSVAPETAARVREYVNENPRLNKTIQFNANHPFGSSVPLAFQDYDDQQQGLFSRPRQPLGLFR